MRKLKAIVLGWTYRLATSLPPSLGIWIVNRSLPVKRPVLDYIEFHLADHCNLNCAGCSHFAPYADKRFADIEKVRRDFNRLKELFSNIRHVRIMGGEPLLHEDAASFVRLVRTTFPRSNVRVVTNGLKLVAAGNGGFADFLATLKSCGVGIDWTCYPPVARHRSDMLRLCHAAGVDLRITDSDTFWARIREKGDADPIASFRWCRRHVYCPYLDDGRLYLCAQARLSGCYNRVSGTDIPVDDGIDIHSATAKDILLYLMRPSRTCAYCDAGARYFKWNVDVKPSVWLRNGTP